MKISDAFVKAVGILEQNDIENAEFDVNCLIEKAFGISKTERLVHPDKEVDFSQLSRLVEERVIGTPLQYILGEWDFYGYTYSVGEGVLIPRPETENLVSCVINYSNRFKNPVIYDLCSGSGCIGLTLARMIDNSSVYLFEKSDEALKYLNKNAEGVSKVSVIKADIFNFDFSDLPKPDIIVSNPPYVKTDEIPHLQREVLSEPKIALDGGKDGLDFYRVIASRFLPLLNKNGMVFVECGEDQSPLIYGIFKPHLNNLLIESDFRFVNRIIIGEK